MVLEIAGGVLLAFFILLGLSRVFFSREGCAGRGCGCALLIVIALVVFVYLLSPVFLKRRDHVPI